MAKIVKLKRHFIDIEMKQLGLSRTGWQGIILVKNIGFVFTKRVAQKFGIDAAHLARILEILKLKDISKEVQLKIIGGAYLLKLPNIVNNI